ncbi:uncharacterized protein ASCRUDRAFT_77339 [Ascoidea rubescens DSM 1968]|uniref:Uncharacterized protein n=1 Tax=Ascoidea rubescens DSM 1968 TaxID=1344418 RepID=A0A1D2VCN7_9ASCO|nr:hypothetical protein ASCRUDRAFT_77339 [Ascoidea rubescens DSM 1968]ODV59270.1 hypothetical protein ASCRUDRAFT_77339 [Ascoidea rubescens DSM 1968]
MEKSNFNSAIKSNLNPNQKQIPISLSRRPSTSNSKPTNISSNGSYLRFRQLNSSSSTSSTSNVTVNRTSDSNTKRSMKITENGKNLKRPSVRK